MLTQYEIPAFIAGKLPQVKQDFSNSATPLTAYQSIQVLTDYTKRMAMDHNYKMLKQCMTLADNIYKRGNKLVKNAIENVFIFSFSTLMLGCNIVEWRIVQSYMPSDLYMLFVEQVLKSK